MNSFWKGLALAPVVVTTLLSVPAGVVAAEGPSRYGSLGARYNFPAATRGDRFARSGISMRTGIRGWKRYGKLIKQTAAQERIDPYVLGAYVWVESRFDEKQNYKRGKAHAIGLGSVQAPDYRRYTIKQLMDPKLNLKLTAKEFRYRWKPNDMAGTVMDVWYPAWRRLQARGEAIPVIKTPETYVQAIANRYYALRDIDARVKTR